MIGKLLHSVMNENGFSDMALGTLLLLLVAAAGVVVLAIAMGGAGGLP